MHTGVILTDQALRLAVAAPEPSMFPKCPRTAMKPFVNQEQVRLPQSWALKPVPAWKQQTQAEGKEKLRMRLWAHWMQNLSILAFLPSFRAGHACNSRVSHGTKSKGPRERRRVMICRAGETHSRQPLPTAPLPGLQEGQGQDNTPQPLAGGHRAAARSLHSQLA